LAIYLIAGAAGFIAARVAQKLLLEGHQVVGIDNLNAAYDVRMKEYRLNQLRALPGFIFEQLDVSDRQVISRLEKYRSFDAVINLAARAGVRAALEDPWVYVDTNITGTLNLLDLCRRMNVPKFVLASTSSIYGLNAPLPTPESANSDYPMQPYAASKKGAEAMCYAYHHLYGIDITIFRYFTVYGPAGRPDMVMFRFVQWLVEGQPLRLNGDGEQSRGFTYVDDIAVGTILGLKPLGYEIINLGGHEVITINQLIRMLEKMIGKKAFLEVYPFNRADMITNLADVTKAGDLLGWEPKISISVGVQRMVDWYLQEREWASKIITD
jgi:UDP-glucuronate 4-epimerase